VVGPTGDDPNLDPVLWVPTRKPVKDIDILPRIQVIDRSLSVDLEGMLATPTSSGMLCLTKDSLHLDVDGSPPDLILAPILVDDPLILGRTTGLLPGEVDECTT